jgi:hypothetical protein
VRKILYVIGGFRSISELPLKQQRYAAQTSYDALDQFDIF